MSGYVGRLAPSPTGLLHLGHARTFLMAGDRARAAGGELLLRMDDLDRARCREEFAEAAREDLRWLGLGWTREVRQSERLEMYRAALERLLARGLAYPCGCSRRELREAVAAPHEEDDEPVYPGFCRPAEALPLEFEEGVNYRFRVAVGESVAFDDEACGPQRLEVGDFLVWRKDGLPSYQLASVVDDEELGVTEVVRGRDLLKSTARQILLQRSLGYAPPRWFHAELVRDAGGVRLAKRQDALSLRQLRAEGVTAEELRTRLGLNLHLREA